jgi:8-oxo-dGTP pyrophosphatase MutT (NUDIX family)
MPTFSSTHVEVYVFRRRRGRAEFLALRRSPGRSLGGVWQPVTGKRKRGERGLAAAVRETREETGLAAKRWWSLETVTLYYESDSDSVHLLPLFVAEVDARSSVKLSREHDAARWMTARGFGACVLWEAQRRGLEAVRREILERPRLARALDVTKLVRKSR